MLRLVTLYFAVPLVISLTLIGMYFSGVQGLQQIVAPAIKNMNPDSSRELGLLENLQNIELIVIAAMAFWAVKIKPARWEKVAFGFIGLAVLFLLMEEIDYGLHYIEYARGVTWQDSVEVRNLHNQGKNTTQILKQLNDIATILLFLVFPLVFWKSKNALIQYVRPSVWSIATLAAMLIVRTVAHELRDAGVGTIGSISRGNISEFRELVTYYLGILYVHELVFARRFGMDNALPERDVTQKEE